MSMAMVSLFGPSVVTSLGFRPHRYCRKGHTSLSCRASSGGSRRDYEKILARQEKRRVRHMKGVTPSTPDLIKTLDSEKRDQAKLDQEVKPDKDGVAAQETEGAADVEDDQFDDAADVEDDQFDDEETK